MSKRCIVRYVSALENLLRSPKPARHEALPLNHKSSILTASSPSTCTRPHAHTPHMPTHAHSHTYDTPCS